MTSAEPVEHVGDLAPPTSRMSGIHLLPTFLLSTLPSLSFTTELQLSLAPRGQGAGSSLAGLAAPRQAHCVTLRGPLSTDDPGTEGSVVVMSGVGYVVGTSWVREIRFATSQGAENDVTDLLRRGVRPVLFT